MRELVAVAIADIHLSAEPPRFRSGEKDWLECQRRVLKQVFDLASKTPNNGNKIPVLIAGDLFNTPTPPPEIIHFALDIFGECQSPIYAIPGNHDLPNHRYEDMSKSAYGVLVKAGYIQNVPPKESLLYRISPEHLLRIWGFPCGTEVTPRRPHTEGFDVALNIALVHSYIWKPGRCYSHAPQDVHMDSYLSKLKGYHIAIFGDNHKGFFQHVSPDYRGVLPDIPAILNCGTPIIRKSDEKSVLDPGIGLIYSDGAVDRLILNTDEDIYSESPGEEEKEPEPLNVEEQEALTALASLGEQSLNFSEFLRHVLQRKTIRVKVKDLILEFLDNHEKE